MIMRRNDKGCTHQDHKAIFRNDSQIYNPITICICVSSERMALVYKYVGLSEERPLIDDYVNDSVFGLVSTYGWTLAHEERSLTKPSAAPGEAEKMMNIALAGCIAFRPIRALLGHTVSWWSICLSI